MSDEHSFIKFDGVSDVANNVINKISSAISWCVNRETPEKIAVNNYIKEIKQCSYDPITKAALISNTSKIIKEYSNQVNIVKRAIDMITCDKHINDVDDDWISVFMDKAKTVSNEDIQMIWAKILAGEMEKPGAYSLRTLDVMRNLSKSEAECFQKVSKLAFESSNKYVISDNDSILNKYNVRFSDLLMLDECGILSSQRLTLTLNIDDKYNEKYFINNKKIAIIKKINDHKKITDMGVYSFTKCGCELLQSLTEEKNNDYFIDVLSNFKKNNSSIEIKTYDILSYKVDCSIDYDSASELVIK